MSALPPEVEERIRAAVVSGQDQIARAGAVAESRLRGVYRRALAAIRAHASVAGADAFSRERLIRQIEDEIARLSNRATGIIREHVAASARIATQTAAAEANIIAPYLVPGITISAVGAFDRAYLAAVARLQFGVRGMELSSRIWELHATSLEGLRRLIGDAMARQAWGSEIIRSLKNFLIFPDADMRTTRWREFFKQYPPGRGAYRSAYKNALRVLRTEEMRAVRIAQSEYARQTSWASGVQWTLSTAHPRPDICDEFAAGDLYGLGPGVYPPGEAPDSAHPQCLCYLVIVPKAEFTQGVIPAQVA